MLMYFNLTLRLEAQGKQRVWMTQNEPKRTFNIHQLALTSCVSFD